MRKEATVKKIVVITKFTYIDSLSLASEEKKKKINVLDTKHACH